MRSSFVTTSVAAVALMTASTSFGAYFFEAENFTDSSSSPAPLVHLEGTGPFAGAEMSGNAYLDVVAGSNATFQIPADTLAPGTYYPAIRSSSASGEGLFMDRNDSALVAPTGYFDAYGLTYNPESGVSGEMGWDWVEDYWNGNAFAVFTVVAGQANTLRLSSATGHTISVDLIAFLDSNDALPTYVPEPASLGFLAAGATLLTARRRRA